MYFLLGNLGHGAVLALEACLEDEGPETYQCVAALWKKLGLPLWPVFAGSGILLKSPPCV